MESIRVFRRRPTASARKQATTHRNATERAEENQVTNESAEENHERTEEEPVANERTEEEPVSNERTEENDDIDEENEEDNEGDEEDSVGELLTGPFPGGPEDPSILCSFKTHVAAAIWENSERGVLKCHCLTSKLLKWRCDGSSEAWKTFVRRAGLIHLRKMSYKGPNRNLISAFVERWHPETNTFHLPFGEMTITLDDVHCITRLRVSGRPVQFVGGKAESGKDVICRLLGVSNDEAKAAVAEKCGSSVKLKWLLSKFGSSTSSDDEVVSLYAAKAYLVYLVGCTIFADKSGDRVSTNYLSLFDDPNKYETYAWGAAALANLYRQLGMTSRVGVRQISGYLTLLEAWIYEHFPTIVRLQPDAQHNATRPLASRWSQKTHPGGSIVAVKEYRKLLDSLRAEDVVWDPYHTFRDSYGRPEVAFYEGCITSGDIVEPYHPDRVLRQFGHVQTIPRSPLHPTKVRRGKKSGQYSVSWGVTSQLFQNCDSHKLDVDRRGRLAEPAWQCVPEYMRWYYSISHPIVQRTENRSQQDHHHASSPWDGY